MQNKHPPLWILLFLVSFASVTAVLFTPALPELTRVLSISDNAAQFTISIFLLGYALGNLPYGPLAKRYGRKKALYLGTTIAILGTILSQIGGARGSFGAFIIGRFISAIGSSVGMKVSFTMIADTYAHAEATKKMSMALLSFAITPGLAVALGGFLTGNYGWQGCFTFLNLYNFFLLFLIFFLPETAPQLDAKALHPKNILGSFKEAFGDEKIVKSALLISGGTTFGYLFASVAPFIVITYLKLSPEEFGLLSVIPPVGMIAGLFLSKRLADKLSTAQSLMLGSFVFLAFGMMLGAFFFTKKLNPFTLYLPIPFMYVGLSMIYSNASSFAMSHAKDKSYASSTMNFLNIFVSFVLLSVIQIFNLSPLVILPWAALGIGFGLLALQRTIKKA